MNKEQCTSEFISRLFSLLNEEKVTYCVLRNYNGLPRKVGNDIDIWVQNGEQRKFQKLLVDAARHTNWELVQYSPRLSYRGEGDYFFMNNVDELHIIHIDCWSFLYWRGVNYVDADVFPRHLEFHEKGFYTVSAGIEGSVNLLKNLIYHGKIQEKYKEQIIEYSHKDSNVFVKAISRSYGKRSADFILSSAKAGKWDELEKRVNFLRWTLYSRAFINRPYFQIKQSALYLWGQIKKYLFPTSGLFIVLLGPDGSGKSTTSKAILNSEVKKLFQRKLYFHGHFKYLPELKRIISFFSKDNKKNKSLPTTKNIVSSEPFRPFRSVIYPLYYGINYFCGHLLIWKEKARGGLVIFDRYFYDYFIQRPFVKCPRWLLRFISDLIPKPDAIIYLKNDPEVIYNRKPELTIDEIRRQAVECDIIIKRSVHGFIIDTSESLEEVSKKIQLIMIQRLREKNKQGIL